MSYLYVYRLVRGKTFDFVEDKVLYSQKIQEEMQKYRRVYVRTEKGLHLCISISEGEPYHNTVWYYENSPHNRKIALEALIRCHLITQQKLQHQLQATDSIIGCLSSLWKKETNYYMEENK